MPILIPLQVGISQTDLSLESAREVIRAIDDWFDGEMPDDVKAFRDRLLSHFF